ncbi:hypothetical protein, partial [Formosa algae]|uniref:hypothetical protein n=1 Tax=Formosa algae TaxID=225843 RepID=UPI001C0ED90B
VDPLFHKYSEPPLAVNVTDSPDSMVLSSPASATGKAFTVTVTLLLLRHRLQTLLRNTLWLYSD